MSDDARPPASLTIDLSSARTGTRPRKGQPQGKRPPPVVTQTINLSTPKPPKPEPAPTAQAPSGPHAKAPSGKASPARPSGKSGPRGGRTANAPAPRDAQGGTSLADLLDEATLARLRGR